MINGMIGLMRACQNITTAGAAIAILLAITLALTALVITLSRRGGQS